MGLANKTYRLMRGPIILMFGHHVQLPKYYIYLLINCNKNINAAAMAKTIK